VDVQKDEIINTLHFDSETECRSTTPWRGRLLNLQDQNIFVVIDPATDQVMDVSGGKCEGNHAWRWTQNTIVHFSRAKETN